MNKKFNLKINIEAREQENKEKNPKKMFSMLGNQTREKNLCSYIKTEPCYVSQKEPTSWEENTQRSKNQAKPKKKNRINKVYSMQPTINDHIKSKLDHKTGSNVGTTEEEFESEEISEGDINIDEANRIEKVEISQGVVYGIGGIPVNKQMGHNQDEFSSENKENLNKKENGQSVIF